MKTPEKPRPLTARVYFLTRLLKLIVRSLCATVRLKIDRDKECQELIRQHGGAILVTWHGRYMVCIDHFRGHGYHMLVSLSKDGDLQSEFLRATGLKPVRGSTGRRGVAATREVVDALKGGGVLAFTPDGPRGPAEIAQPGVAYFAQRSGRPIIPAGISAYPRWQLSTWDKHLIPKPFAQVRWIYGEPIFVGPDDNLDEVAVRVTEAINALQDQAEAIVVPEKLLVKRQEKESTEKREYS